MATPVLSNDDFHTNTDDKNLEIFSLIWLDENVNVKDIRDTEQKLRSIINHLKKFQDIKQCLQYIEKRSEKDRLILIVSGQFGQEIIPFIHNLRQVISIYIYCMDKISNEKWAYKFPKVKSVIVKSDQLISQITAHHKIHKKVEEPLSINIFTTNVSEGKSTTGLNGQFVFSQVLIDCLLRLKYTQTDKIEFINLCKTEYEDNHNELNNLREFEEEYSSNKVLWWYSRDSFFYRTLNAALRTQNIHVIFLFREFISDIQSRLQYDQAKNPLQVYRSQLMSVDELDDLKRNIGQFISIQSFFSTSTDRTTALFFLGDPTSLIDSNLEGVLFEIDADPQKVTTKPFADISQYSHFTNESEVLFMIGSIFRLKNIYLNEDLVWIIEMSLCSDDEHDLKQVVLHVKQQIGNGEINLRTLGKILGKMGRFDLAEKYFKRLLNELSQNDPLICNLYEDLGELASQTGDYDMSVEWHQKSLEFKRQNECTGEPLTSLRDRTIKKRKIIIKPKCLCGHIGLFIISGLILAVFVLKSKRKDTKWKQEGITIAGVNSQGNQLNRLSRPRGIFIDDDQNIYVADQGNDRIVEWKSNARNGQIVAGGSGEGNQTNHLDSPKDVIIDKENNLLIICDHGNRRVMRWSRQNKIKNREIIISNIDCYGLAMDKDGSLYVSDNKKHEVRQWKRGDQYGTIVAGGNGQGNHLNQFNSPSFMSIDEDYSLYVSDWSNYRVMKWLQDAKEGIVVAGGNGQGYSLTQLSSPAGVIVDQLGQIYVADWGNHRVMRWCKGAKEGTTVVGGNGQGNQSNQFNHPTSLSFDRQGNLYVVDQGNNRIQKFQIN